MEPLEEAEEVEDEEVEEVEEVELEVEAKEVVVGGLVEIEVVDPPED